MTVRALLVAAAITSAVPWAAVAQPYNVNKTLAEFREIGRARFRVTVGATTVDVYDVDFTRAANFGEVASLIEDAINAAGLSVTVEYRDQLLRFSSAGGNVDLKTSVHRSAEKSHLINHAMFSDGSNTTTYGLPPAVWSGHDFALHPTLTASLDVMSDLDIKRHAVMWPCGYDVGGAGYLAGFGPQGVDPRAEVRPAPFGFTDLQTLDPTLHGTFATALSPLVTGSDQVICYLGSPPIGSDPATLADWTGPARGLGMDIAFDGASGINADLPRIYATVRANVAEVNRAIAAASAGTDRIVPFIYWVRPNPDWNHSVLLEAEYFAHVVRALELEGVNEFILAGWSPDSSDVSLLNARVEQWADAAEALGVSGVTIHPALFGTLDSVDLTPLGAVGTIGPKVFGVNGSELNQTMTQSQMQTAVATKISTYSSTYPPGTWRLAYWEYEATLYTTPPWLLSKKLDAQAACEAAASNSWDWAGYHLPWTNMFEIESSGMGSTIAINTSDADLIQTTEYHAPDFYWLLPYGDVVPTAQLADWILAADGRVYTAGQVKTASLEPGNAHWQDGQFGLFTDETTATTALHDPDYYRPGPGQETVVTLTSGTVASELAAAPAWVKRGYEVAVPLWQRSGTSDDPAIVAVRDLSWDTDLIGEGVVSCYANCDGSTAPPVLNINDFICFMARYNAQDPRANCDGTTAAPIVTINDQICFQAAFVAGCP